MGMRLFRRCRMVGSCVGKGVRGVGWACRCLWETWDMGWLQGWVLWLRVGVTSRMGRVFVWVKTRLVTEM
jgi:hypothetical protein